MQPGGKIEPHEQPLGALIRELQEELGLTIQPSDQILPIVGWGAPSHPTNERPA
jgi:8-oxo-dGTP pyrophosphatase MutT (NUDIX family)